MFYPEVFLTEQVDTEDTLVVIPADTPADTPAATPAATTAYILQDRFKLDSILDSVVSTAVPIKILGKFKTI